MYEHSRCRDLHVRSGYVCVDERIAIPNLIQEAGLESPHLTSPGSWMTISPGQNAIWPKSCREFLKKSAKCKPRPDFDKDLKPEIHASK